jgi:hypothetical protein
MNADDVKYKIEVMQAYAEGKEIQWICKLTDEEWEDCPNPGFNWARNDYRVKPAEKPSINWDHVSDRFNYLTLDNKGEIESAWLYAKKPFWDYGWNSGESGDTVASATFFKSLNPGNCEPEESLICRPGFE